MVDIPDVSLFVRFKMFATTLDAPLASISPVDALRYSALMLLAPEASNSASLVSPLRTTLLAPDASASTFEQLRSEIITFDAPLHSMSILSRIALSILTVDAPLHSSSSFLLTWFNVFALKFEAPEIFTSLRYGAEMRTVTFVEADLLLPLLLSQIFSVLPSQEYSNRSSAF